MNGHAALVGQVEYSPDNSTLYAAINGQNTVVALDPDTGAVEHTWNVGIAPRELTFVGKQALREQRGWPSGPARRDDHGLLRHQDARQRVPRDVDERNRQRHRHRRPGGGGRIDRGRPAPDRDVRPGQGALFVANTNGDTVSVIDTKKNRVVQTIETKPWPSSDAGYAPTSIAMTADDHLLVTLGRANAVAVYQYQGTRKNR